MVSSPQCGELGGPGEHWSSTSWAAWLPHGWLRRHAAGGRDRPPGWHRRFTALWKGFRHGGQELPNPDLRTARRFPARTRTRGDAIATVGCYTIDDRIEAQEALGLVNQLRDSIGVGMVDAETSSQ